MKLETVKSTLFAKHQVNHGFITKNINFKAEKEGDISAGYANLGGYLQERIISLDQVHSDEIFIDNGCNLQESLQQEADGIISTQKNTAIVIKTADCVPILITNLEKTMIAGVHSGWRGSLAGINENMIATLEDMGFPAHTLLIGIGPGISQRNYEVGKEFYENFLNHDSSSGIFFYCDENGKIYFDNKRYVYHKYEKLGAGAIEMIDIDTYADGRFFSYRANLRNIPSKNGTQGSFITL